MPSNRLQCEEVIPKKFLRSKIYRSATLQHSSTCYVDDAFLLHLLRTRIPVGRLFYPARHCVDLSLAHVPRGSPSSFVNNLTSNLLLQVLSRLSSRIESAPRRPCLDVPKTVLVLRGFYSICLALRPCLPLNTSSVPVPACTHVLSMLRSF